MVLICRIEKISPRQTGSAVAQRSHEQFCRHTHGFIVIDNRNIDT